MAREPELFVCPDCGIGLQRGKGKHNLCHHECRTASTGSVFEQLDAVSSAIIRRVEVIAKSADSTLDDLAQASSIIQRLRGSNPIGRPPKAKKEESPASPDDRVRDFLGGKPRLVG